MSTVEVDTARSSYDEPVALRGRSTGDTGRKRSKMAVTMVAQQNSRCATASETGQTLGHREA